MSLLHLHWKTALINHSENYKIRNHTVHFLVICVMKAALLFETKDVKMRCYY